MLYEKDRWIRSCTTGCLLWRRKWRDPFICNDRSGAYSGRSCVALLKHFCTPVIIVAPALTRYQKARVVNPGHRELVGERPKTGSRRSIQRPVNTTDWRSRGTSGHKLKAHRGYYSQ